MNAPPARPARRVSVLFRAGTTLPLALLVAVAAAGDDARDRRLEGYLAAVLERDLGLRAREIRVRDGHAHLVLEEMDGGSPTRVAEVAARVEGIERVAVSLAGAEDRVLVRVGEEVEEEGGGLDVLPPHELFEPLLADPRQPHFSAVYQWYLDDPELARVGSANFGETFALLGGELGEGRWELGLLGGVFSIFDLDAESFDLVNSDFWVGPTLSARRDGLSAQLRVYHQSSHLGDEFVLRNRADRVNLSYEGVDLLVSAQVHPALRLYAGGGVIVHDEPNLDPLSAQLGAELRSPVTFADGLVRPVAAVDFQAREENDWREELGVAGGVELANPVSPGLRLQILASYFRGNSPNGQFFERRIESLGVGLHLHF